MRTVIERDLGSVEEFEKVDWDAMCANVVEKGLKRLRAKPPGTYRTHSDLVVIQKFAFIEKPVLWVELHSERRRRSLCLF